ncbi:DUF3152 domain-containing protein [Nocardioides sp. W3-2-3]|nr:DUF3152 domain-containing protein [Nocardioides convexus]
MATGTSKAVGSGRLVTYSVEIEEGLPYAVNDVAEVVERVLGDDRGWASAMGLSLRRVTSSPDFRIRLSTPKTSDELCAPLNTGGRLSCRNGQMVVLNAWRWANGADAYASDLRNYRAYMINHEFGHALGNAHRTCPGKGHPDSGHGSADEGSRRLSCESMAGRQLDGYYVT